MTLVNLLAIAAAFWGVHAPGVVPACGAPTITNGDLSALRNVDGPGIYVQADADPATCSIVIDVASLGDPVTAWASTAEYDRVLCALTVHEYGHLLGLQHSLDPADVMYPQPLPPPECDDAFPLPFPPFIAPDAAPLRIHRHHHRHRHHRHLTRATK